MSSILIPPLPFFTSLSLSFWETVFLSSFSLPHLVRFPWRQATIHTHTSHLVCLSIPSVLPPCDFLAFLSSIFSLYTHWNILNNFVTRKISFRGKSREHRTIEEREMKQHSQFIICQRKRQLGIKLRIIGGDKRKWEWAKKSKKQKIHLPLSHVPFIILNQ